MKRDLPPYVYRLKGVPYFVRRGWQTVRIASEPNTPEFWAEYALILKGTPAQPSGKTFRALIASYKRSERYTSKARRTRQDYDKVLAFIDDRLGERDPRHVKPPHVFQWAHQRGGRAGAYLVQVLNILYRHGREVGMTDHNPAKGIRLPRGDPRPREPWPVEMIDHARKVATGDDLLLLELLIGTGQRIGDVLALQWGQVGADGITMRQSKTGAGLFIPYTPRLRSALSEAPRKGLYVLLSKRGGALSYRAASDRMRKLRDRIGAAPGNDIHALRYTAAHELAEAGCNDEEIEAITGHKSRAMVRKYAGPARQRRRAQDAQDRRK